jgi:endonuclease/exonuclease/phosphatase family metal-dependent hydrolase
MRVRVLTFNIWNTQGDPRRLDLINAEIKRVKPDLIAFQEVVQSDEAQQLIRLLEGTDLQGTHQSDVMLESSPWVPQYGGSALATRWPHQIVEVLDLRTADALDIPWATVAAIVSLPDEGNPLFIAAIGAWRPAAEAVRERQAVALTDLDARHRQTLPTIIAGYFNAWPEAASIRYLSGLQSLQGRSVCYHDAWAVAGGGPGVTWTNENPSRQAEISRIIRQPRHQRRLDYIFVGSWGAHPKARCEIRSATLVFNQPCGGVWPSDHFGVLADLEISADRV